MHQFDGFVGVDYSGADHCEKPLPGLQLYRTGPTGEPEAVRPLLRGGSSRSQHHSRAGIAAQIAAWLEQGECLAIGVDHGFGLPQSYLDRYRLANWDAFLVDFCQAWPLTEPGRTVDQIRQAGPTRHGESHEYRLTERWSSSAKSVFLFDVQGSVAKSTHAGLPFLAQLRQRFAAKLHVWPFDGWVPAPGVSLIAEVYPSLFRHRYAKGNRSTDAHDAYAVARWLQESVRYDRLMYYLRPPLTLTEASIARREGWILGIT
jgi:hypothetical protein